MKNYKQTHDIIKHKTIYMSLWGIIASWPLEENKSDVQIDFL